MPLKSNFAIAVLLALLASRPAAALEPVLEDSERALGYNVMGSASGNPHVHFKGDLSKGDTVRNRFTEAARWIVSDDFDGDGQDEAAVLFEDGTLKFLYLDRGNLRARSSVSGLSPEAPPVVIREYGGETFQGVLVVDDRGDLSVASMDGGSRKRLASGLSSLTSAVIADLDGDGRSEIAGVNDEGQFLLLTGRSSSTTSSRTELLPDTRLTVADTDGDGKREVFALSRPSGDFTFGRLGDDLEATGLAVFTWDGKFLSLADELVLSRGLAFECLSAAIADLDSGEKNRILVTVSEEGAGSRLETYDYARGRLKQERKGPGTEAGAWVMAVGAADLGDAGRSSVIAVSDPDSGKGTLELFRSDLAVTRPKLERSISTHIPSSRVLGMALIGDFDSDGQLELLAPGKDRTSISIFELEKSRIRAREIYTGSRELSSNLCPGDFNGDGKSDVLAGFSDGGMIILVGR